MKTVDEYFIKETDNISFLELKKGTKLQIGNFSIDDKLPLPIIVDTLIEEIQEGSLQDEIEISHIIDGMIFLLGVDINFKYNEEYEKLLYEYNSNIEDYILYKGFQYVKENNIKYATIFFRALVNINNNNINGIFNYALCLENLAIKFADEGNSEESMNFLCESTRQLESILDISEDFPLVYYKLGYHYRYYNQFIKAKLMWEKYLSIDDDLDRIQEIREQLKLIEDDVNFEEGVSLLSHGEYFKAVNIFSKLSNKYRQGNILYLTGLAYKGLGDYESAIDYFYEALDVDFKDINVYNELGICLFTSGYLKEALDIFNQGINLYPTDYKIVFNRGLLYFQIGDIDKAVEDIETAHRLNPDDVFIKEQLIKIKHNYV